MENQNLFKWKHYQPDIILLTVRWYLRYTLSFRDLVEMMEERGLSIAHTTIMRWVHQYGPELDERVRRHFKITNDFWRVNVCESKRSMDVFISCSRFKREYH
jgi:transposase, IS6 family